MIPMLSFLGLTKQSRGKRVVGVGQLSTAVTQVMRILETSESGVA